VWSLSVPRSDQLNYQVHIVDREGWCFCVLPLTISLLLWVRLTHQSNVWVSTDLCFMDVMLYVSLWLSLKFEAIYCKWKRKMLFLASPLIIICQLITEYIFGNKGHSSLVLQSQLKRNLNQLHFLWTPHSSLSIFWQVSLFVLPDYRPPVAACAMNSTVPWTSLLNFYF
jgi:hypothetical protein